VGSVSAWPADDAAHGLGVAMGAARRERQPAAPDASRSAAAAPTSVPIVTREGQLSAPEEVAVCELCGLVSRLPRPIVCPACGGGYG
jgi:rubrerythrin